MARKSSDDSAEQTEQTTEATAPRPAATSGSTETQESDVDAGMRHETHGELPSERPASDF